MFKFSVGSALLKNRNRLSSNFNFAMMKMFSYTFKNLFLKGVGVSTSSKSITSHSSTLTEGNSLIRYQKFYLRSVKSKRKHKLPNTKRRMYNHQGLMKRIRIIGPRWDRGFKFYPTNYVHKRTNKSRANLRSKKQPRYICKADITRVKMLLPLWKRQKYKH